MATNSPTTWRSCDLCGATQTRTRYEVDGYHIVECTKCSLVFVGEEVSREELDKYYGQAYYAGGGNAYGDYMGHAESRKHHYRSLLPNLRRYLPQAAPLRVLDVGCAAGFFLDVAQEVGWQATGVELSPYMSEQARGRGLDVKTGSLEEVDLPLGTFHLITMWDMIEHAQHPRAVLERAFDLLAPGGLLVAATGDIAGATARIYGTKWSLLAPPGHLFYFSQHTLFAMLKKAGFAPLDSLSDGAFLVNDRNAFLQAGGWKRAAVTLQRPRLVKALLRRLKWGNVITVFARKP